VLAKPTATLLLLPAQLPVLMFSILTEPVATVAPRIPRVSFSSAVAARMLCIVARSGEYLQARKLTDKKLIVSQSEGTLEEWRTQGSLQGLNTAYESFQAELVMYDERWTA